MSYSRTYTWPDSLGVLRCGLAQSWWVTFKDKPRYDLPLWRVYAWNVFALGFAGADLWWAYRLRILWPALAGIAVMVVLTGWRLVAIQRRVERDAERNIAIAWAAHRARQQAVVETEPERVAA